VAREWAQFCSKPGYVINAIGKNIAPSHDYHAQVTCPITSIWSSDDEIATEANVKDLLRLYPNAKTQIIELRPKSYAYKTIGHMLMFKKSHQNLWPVIEQQLTV
jgi:predicted alpha/beta hydrolase